MSPLRIATRHPSVTRQKDKRQDIMALLKRDFTITTDEAVATPPANVVSLYRTASGFRQKDSSGTASDVGGGGGGATLLGPYEVNYDDAGLSGDGVALGSAIPAGTTIVRLWAVIEAAWTDDGSVRLDLGLVNGDPAMGDYSVFKVYDNVDGQGTSLYEGVWAAEFPPGVGGVDNNNLDRAVTVLGANVKLWATTTQTGGASAGVAKVYAATIPPS